MAMQAIDTFDVWMSGCFYLMLFVLIALYLTWRKKERDAQEILSNPLKLVPGPAPARFSTSHGNLEDIQFAGSLHEYLLWLHRKYGPLASFWLDELQIVSIASTQLFKEHQKCFDRPAVLFEMSQVLIGSRSIQFRNGEEGKKLHKMFSRPFAFTECRNYYGTFHEIGKQLVEKLEAYPASSHVAVWENMVVVAIKGLLETAFGYLLTDNETALKIDKKYTIAWSKIESIFSRSNLLYGEDRIERAIKWYRNFAWEVLEARKASVDKGNADLFVDVLLNSEEDDETRLDNAVTFITGGFHTTSTLLTWALYYMAENQYSQDIAYNELNKVLGDGDITPENIKDLKYLKKVLDETLRITALAPYAARCSDQYVTLGGISIPPNTPVIHALGVVLTTEEEWDGAASFDPDRFEEYSNYRPSLAFSPFGFAGQRICPGQRFAYIETSIILGVLLRRLKFKMVGGQDIRKSYGLVTKPSTEIWMTVEPRTTSAKSPVDVEQDKQDETPANFEQ